jgi:transposase
MDICRWIVEVVLRPEQAKGSVLLKKRWLMECRRLVRNYERLTDTAKVFIYLAMIRIMLRQLAQIFTPDSFSNIL